MINIPIIKQKEIAVDTVEIVFGLEGKEFSFQPGQYIRVTIPNLHCDPKGNHRDFSIVSSPNNKDSLSIAFRVSNSEFKQSILKAPLGTQVSIEGPFGSFIASSINSIQSVVFIAGGIGITPFLSMIRFAAEEKLSHQITLLYANKNRNSAAYTKELEDIRKQNPNFIIKNKFELIDTSFIQENIKNSEDSLVFIAGPTDMVVHTKELLVSMNIPKEKIYFEEFTGYESDTAVASEINNVHRFMKQLPREFFKIVMELSFDGIAITDTEGIIQYANPAWLKLTGWNENEIVGKVTPRIIKSGQESRRFYAQLWYEIKSGNVFRFDITNKHKDGSLYIVNEVIVPVKNDKEEIIAFIGFSKDITKRVEVEKNLKAKIFDLGRFNKLAIGRELKMIELKKTLKQAQGKIKELKEKLKQ